MAANTMLYIGSAVIILWGIAHIVPTRSVVAGFGDVSIDNRRIITMEWIAEGLTLCFIGVLVLVVTAGVGLLETGSLFVIRASAVMLIVMAMLTFITGGQTSITAMKICPYIKGFVATLFFVASILAGGL